MATVTNLECTVAVLEKHREARGWTDQEVAADLLAQLGLDADGPAKNPAQVVQHEPAHPAAEATDDADADADADQEARSAAPARKARRGHP